MTHKTLSTQPQYRRRAGVLCRIVGHRWRVFTTSETALMVGGMYAVMESLRCRRCQGIRLVVREPEQGKDGG